MAAEREEILALLQEATYSIRKAFGMFGQIRVEIRDVSPKELTVGISTRKRLEGAQLAENVRNAMLNSLRDLLPVERFVAIYDNAATGTSGELHDLPYALLLSAAGSLRSSVIPIEENAGPAREQLRQRFRSAWIRLIDAGNELSINAGLPRPRMLGNDNPNEERFSKPAPTTRAEKRMYKFLQENPGYYCAPFPGGSQYTMLQRMKKAGLVACAPVPFYGENWYAVVDGMPVPVTIANKHWRVPEPWLNWMKQERIPLPQAGESGAYAPLAFPTTRSSASVLASQDTGKFSESLSPPESWEDDRVGVQLRRLAGSDPETSRMAALRLLGGGSDSDARLGRNTRVRENLIREWSSLSSARPDLVASLVNLLLSDGDLLVIEVAAMALAAEGEDGLTEIVNLLEEEDFVTRHKAAIGISMAGRTGRWAVPKLLALLEKERDSLIELNVIEALGEIGGREAFVALEQMYAREREMGEPSDERLELIERALAASATQL